MYSLENKQKPWQVIYSKYMVSFPRKVISFGFKVKMYTHVYYCLRITEEEENRKTLLWEKVCFRAFSFKALEENQPALLWHDFLFLFFCFLLAF